MPLRPLHFRIVILPGLLAMLAASAGCATLGPVETKPPAAAVEEQPEPLPKGIKPLTVEQEEMIQQ